MDKAKLLHTLQSEIRRHDFSTFVDEPPSVGRGGNGVVVLGCPQCKKRLNTRSQFLDLLVNERNAA